MTHENQGQRWRDHIKRYTPKTPQQTLFDAATSLVEQVHEVDGLIVAAPRGNYTLGAAVDELVIRAKVLRMALDACDHGLRVVDVPGVTRYRPIEQIYGRSPVMAEMDKFKNHHEQWVIDNTCSHGTPPGDYCRKCDDECDPHHDDAAFKCPCPECR